MTHAEDLAYLRSRMGAAEFERFMEDWARELVGLESEATLGGPGNAEIQIRQNVKGGRVTDTWLHPRPIRYRSKSA